MVLYGGRLVRRERGRRGRKEGFCWDTFFLAMFWIVLFLTFLCCCSELAKVAKIKAEREKQEKIVAEMKRLQIPRLLAIKGVRRLRPIVVMCDATSLSRRDHFLLETETHLFHYKGEFAPFTSQRTKAVENAQKALQKERMVPLKLVSVKPDDAKVIRF
jgi:hypothetical protein